MTGTLGTGVVGVGGEFDTRWASVVVAGAGTGKFDEFEVFVFLNMSLICSNLFLDSDCSGDRSDEFVVSLMALVRSLAAAMMRSVFDAVGMDIP